jgi:hypothetical protein
MDIAELDVVTSLNGGRRVRKSVSVGRSPNEYTEFRNTLEPTERMIA